MKINYLIIAQHLTGDSELHFFPTPELAKAKYEELTEPLLAICNTKSLEVDDVYFIDEDGKGCRFNAGNDEDIDDIIGEVDHWYKWDSIEVSDDATHYVADFSEYVDESTVTFWNEQSATEHYNDLIDNELEMANDMGHGIDRYDQTTWNNEEGMTLFQESIGKPYGECYFGWNEQPTNTIRCGVIE